jgi:hypothetical protein
VLPCEDASPIAHPASHSHAQIHLSICHHASKINCHTKINCTYICSRERADLQFSTPGTSRKCIAGIVSVLFSDLCCRHCHSYDPE